MPIKLSSLLKHLQRTDGVAPTVREYENSFEEVKRGGLASRQRDYKAFINLYYDLATDFYEYGWGTSFHFAPRYLKRASRHRLRATSTFWRSDSA